jgi:hypothetical protein
MNHNELQILITKAKSDLDELNIKNEFLAKLSIEYLLKLV